LSTPYIHTDEVHNLKAPREIVPIVLKLLKVNSVLDVGCGTGTWLKVFEENSITDYLGIDGTYVDTKRLVIPANKFAARDLRESWSLSRHFDIVLSLEVAEHLPETSADILVSALVNHGDCILFSAAIPGQGGQHHINEQWPSYWIEKFRAHGYHFHDVIRPAVWDNENVEWWYRQNIFLVKKGPPAPVKFVPAIHPAFYERIRKDEAEYRRSLESGQQGLVIATRIFFNSLRYKFTKIFHL
jgi:SAM-dependent methyltransferase